jgi:hypothetical protein
MKLHQLPTLKVLRVLNVFERQKDMQREENKWMPVFDMRDMVLLHTPILWVILHLTISLIICVVVDTVYIVGFILLFYFGKYRISMYLILYRISSHQLDLLNSSLFGTFVAIFLDSFGCFIET